MLILLTPIGVLAPGTAWGEWSAEELKPTLGFVPAGLERLGRAVDRQRSPATRPRSSGTRCSATSSPPSIGAALVVGVTWGIAKLLARGDRDGPAGAPPATA